jgi:Mn-dependent DtxR family transcriptional regulator
MGDGMNQTEEKLDIRITPKGIWVYEEMLRRYGLFETYLSTPNEERVSIDELGEEWERRKQTPPRVNDGR